MNDIESVCYTYPTKVRSAQYTLSRGKIPAMKWRPEQWALFSLPVVWAIVWIVFHYLQPTAFHWLGVIGGAVIAIPLMIAIRIEQRSMAGRDQKDHRTPHENDS
jgi:hypothetical protein